jgi:Flp pilus assembly pilin Flp
MLADERAATAIEYAMIAAGIAAAIAATVFSLGTDVKDQLFQKVSDGLP